MATEEIALLSLKDEQGEYKSEDHKKTDSKVKSEDDKKTDSKEKSEDDKKTDSKEKSEDDKKTDSKVKSKDHKKTDSKEKSEDDKKKTKKIPPRIRLAEALIIFFTLVLLVGLSTLHITRFAYSFVPCDHPLTNDNDNLTEHSGSYEAQAAADKPVDKPVDYHQRYLHFSNLVYIWSSLLHWIEYAYLFYGFRRFIRTALQWPDEFHTSIIKSTKRFVSKEKTRGKVVGIVFYFVLFSIVSFLLPLVGLFHDTGKFHHFKCQLAPKPVVYLYHFFTLIVFIITVLVRLMMVLATSTCGAVWLEMTQEELDKLTAREGSGQLHESLEGNHQINHQVEDSATTLCLSLQLNNGRDWDNAVGRYYKHMMAYETKLDVIIVPIYKVFRSWFVIQWIIYLVSLIIDLSRLVRPWFNNYAIDSLLLSRTALDCVFDVLALTCSYLAALKMNSYLRRYIRKLQATQVKEAKDSENGSMMQYTLCQTLLSITMIPKSHFLPRIPGFGVNISLQGPGFIIGTIITILGLVATLSSF